MQHKFTAFAFAAVLVGLPASATACLSMMGYVSLETFPLDFLWLGNAGIAFGLLFFGRQLMGRAWVQRAWAVSGLILGAGVGLFASNTLALESNFTAWSALLMGFVLANFRIRRSKSELVMLTMILVLAGYAAVDAFSDSRHFAKYGAPEAQFIEVNFEDVQFNQVVF